MKTILGIILTVGMLLGLAVPASAQVEPTVVHKEMKPGESMTVIKTVTTPLIPPKPDIYFLSDTTGSMWPSIAVVKSNANNITATISGLDPSAQFGVGNYKDFPYDPPPVFYHQRSITSNLSAVAAAIGTWTASGGADGPESALYALTKIATDPAIGWRVGASRIVVWFGDAPAHDPVPSVATDLGFDITEATATSALVTAGIRVIAVSVTTGYPLGLNDNPNVGGGDYNAAYYTVEDGASGQATRIAAATGGVALIGVTPDKVVDAILSGLQAIKTDVWWTVVADPGLSVTLTPPVYHQVPSGTTVTFIETISINPSAPCGIFKATVTFWANKYPKEGAVIGTQNIEVGDFTPPKVASVETMNPAGKKIPPAGSTTLPGPKGGMNEDGFYILTAEDNCDPNPQIFVSYVDSSDPYLFGPFASGTVVKFTEAKGAAPAKKKIGSTQGNAGYVDWHIILPADAVVIAIDHAGNVSDKDIQFVPPPPK